MFTHHIVRHLGSFIGGAVIGTVGVKLLSGTSAKKAYVRGTAAVLSARDCVMDKVTEVQENAEDVVAEAKQLNEEKEKEEKEKEKQSKITECEVIKAEDQ